MGAGLVGWYLKSMPLGGGTLPEEWRGGRKGEVTEAGGQGKMTQGYFLVVQTGHVWHTHVGQMLKY